MVGDPPVLTIVKAFSFENQPLSNERERLCLCDLPLAPESPHGRFRRLIEITYMVALLKLNEKGGQKVYGMRPEEVCL